VAKSGLFGGGSLRLVLDADGLRLRLVLLDRDTELEL
jgi:hypothetical protein